jgi:hypothetical protein
MQGLEHKKTPLSDHLFALFADWGKSFVGLTPDFELIFERYELLGSPAHLERNEKASVQSDLAAQTAHAFAWMPIGRIGWHESNADRLLSEVQAEPMKSLCSSRGLQRAMPSFGPSHPELRRIAGRIRW